jgi:hypothetical protein
MRISGVMGLTEIDAAFVLSDDIVGAFPTWAKAQAQYADRHLDNIVVVTLPQPVCIQMIRREQLRSATLRLTSAVGRVSTPISSWATQIR